MNDEIERHNTGTSSITPSLRLAKRCATCMETCDHVNTPNHHMDMKLFCCEHVPENYIHKPKKDWECEPCRSRRMDKRGCCT